MTGPGWGELRSRPTRDIDCLQLLAAKWSFGSKWLKDAWRHEVYAFTLSLKNVELPANSDSGGLLRATQAHVQNRGSTNGLAVACSRSDLTTKAPVRLVAGLDVEIRDALVYGRARRRADTVDSFRRRYHWPARYRRPI